MSEEFKESVFEKSAFKESLILISKRKMADAIECLIKDDLQSNVALKNVILCLLQGREIENYEWFSKNPDTKITAIAELCRLADALQVGKIDGTIRESVEKITYQLICDYGIEIAQESGDYPDSTLSGGVWMNGAILRDWAYFMAQYFNHENDKERELQMLFIRVKVTNAIMSHYHHLVGPAMVDLAVCCIDNDLPEKAEQFFNAVILDFDWLIDEYIDGSTEINEEDAISISALQQAYEGMLRIKKDDKELNSKLKKLKKIMK
jgi:hypothetical protein